MSGEPRPPRSRRRPPGRLADSLASTGARIERLRITVAIVAVAAVVLVGAVLWFGRAVSLDPTRRAVDELDVPAWAAVTVADQAYGSRWCVGECRVRVRTWASEGTAEDTEREYRRALAEQGWTEAGAARCAEGREACHLRDELYLELWVTPASCDDRHDLCAGSEVTVVVAARAALPRLAHDRRIVAEG